MGHNVDFVQILLENIIVLAGIGVVEFSFATYIAQQYLSGDPNYVKRIIIQKLMNLFLMPARMW